MLNITKLKEILVFIATCSVVYGETIAIFLSHGLYSVTDTICNWNVLGVAAMLTYQSCYDYTHTALNVILPALIT